MQGFLLGLVLSDLQTLIYLILEIKRCLLFGRKAMTKQDSEYFAVKGVHIIKAMVFQ